MPPDVQFRRVPVGFGREAWDNLGKAYYTLDALGEEARLTPEVFAALHRAGANLSTPKAFFDWAAGKGLDRKKVEDMFNSFAIAGKMNKANQTAKAYTVQIGAAHHRRRQVPDGLRQGRLAREDAGGDQRAGGQGQERAAQGQELIAP